VLRQFVCIVSLPARVGPHWIMHDTIAAQLSNVMRPAHGHKTFDTERARNKTGVGVRMM
jgi:hypothetical protein